MEKLYIAMVENRDDSPMAWAIEVRITATTAAVAEMYARIAANQWRGNLASVTELTEG